MDNSETQCVEWVMAVEAVADGLPAFVSSHHEIPSGVSFGFQ